MIVVAMTSWVKRIQYVKSCVEALLAQTLVPDRLYLTLSIEEFPNMENDLPTDLVDLFLHNRRLMINWVYRNTKAMKKIIPILPYLEDEDIIINCDEDVIVPPDLIESRVLDFLIYHQPITSKNIPSYYYGMTVLNPTSLFQKKMLANMDKWVNEDVLATHNDDRTYIFALYLNGYRCRYCSKYSLAEKDKSRLYRYDYPDGMGENHVHLIGREYDRIVVPIIEKMTGKPIEECFNYFNTKPE